MYKSGSLHTLLQVIFINIIALSPLKGVQVIIMLPI